MIPAIRQEVESLLARLPSDAQIKDLQYHLYVIEKVQHGLEAQNVRELTQEQAEEKLGKWLIG